MEKYRPISKLELEKFDTELITEIKDTLKVYDHCNVYFENNKYYARARIGLSTSYAPDYKFIGVAYVEDIYTLEERTQNYLETFHEYPGWYVGKRDYKWLRDTYGEFPMNKIRKGKRLEFSKTTGGDIYEYVEENNDNFGLGERCRPYEMEENKYICIKEKGTCINNKPLFNVVNKKHGNVIAEICYYPPWSQYVFTPRENTVWNADCMRFVAAYLDEVNRTTDN